MKRAIIIAAMLAAAGLAGAQMFAQMFGGSVGTPIPAVAWYKLDGSALDSSGNGYHGTWVGTEAYTNGPTAGVPAAWLNGSSQIGITTNFNFSGTASFTAAFWVRYSTTVGDPIVLGHWGYNINRRAWDVPLTSSSLKLSFLACSAGTFTPNVRTESATAIEAGTWYHVCVVRDGANTSFYIGGDLSGNNASGGSIYDTAGGVLTKIGAGGSSLATSTSFVTGAIADVRIYDRALSEANIARIMESQDNEPLEELQ